MKKLAYSMMILCGAAAFALLPACHSTDTGNAKCAKCGSAACAGKCAPAAPANCPKCGKPGCTTCKP